MDRKQVSVSKETNGKEKWEIIWKTIVPRSFIVGGEKTRAATRWVSRVKGRYPKAA